jgi:hypothetical protein
MDRPSRCRAPPQRATVQGYCAQSSQPSDHRTGTPCQMAALYTRSGTVTEIVYELLDALGGWSTAGVGSRYGDAFKLSQKAQWMRYV